MTIIGTVKKLSAPHGQKPVRVKGSGTVTFSAPGCRSGKLTWSGTGQLVQLLRAETAEAYVMVTALPRADIEAAAALLSVSGLSVGFAPSRLWAAWI